MFLGSQFNPFLFKRQILFVDERGVRQTYNTWKKQRKQPKGAPYICGTPKRQRHQIMMPEYTPSDQNNTVTPSRKPRQRQLLGGEYPCITTKNRNTTTAPETTAAQQPPNHIPDPKWQQKTPKNRRLFAIMNLPAPQAELVEQNSRKTCCHDSKQQHTPASPSTLQQPEKRTIIAADSLAGSKSIRRTYTPASLNGSAPTSKLTPW